MGTPAFLSLRNESAAQDEKRDLPQELPPSKGNSSAQMVHKTIASLAAAEKGGIVESLLASDSIDGLNPLLWRFL